MGVLIDGGRDEELPQEVGRAGEFRRAESQFRNRITADGSSGFKAEPGRYRLFVAHGCPWAHLAVAIFAVAGEFFAPSVQAADLEVNVDQFAFYPQRITVKAGTTVTWSNEDDVPHTVASSSRLFKSKALDTKDKFSFTFTTPGTYEYFCSLQVVEAVTGSSSGVQ